MRRKWYKITWYRFAGMHWLHLLYDGYTVQSTLLNDIQPRTRSWISAINSHIILHNYTYFVIHIVISTGRKVLKPSHKWAHSLCCCCCSVSKSCPTLCDPRTIAYQAPLSMQFSRQESWSGLQFPAPGDLLGPGIKPTCPAMASWFFTTKPSGKSYTFPFSLC